MPDGDVDATPEQMTAAQTVIEDRLVGLGITDYESYVDSNKDRIIVRFPWQSGEEDFDPQAAIEEIGTHRADGVPQRFHGGRRTDPQRRPGDFGPMQRTARPKAGSCSFTLTARGRRRLPTRPRNWQPTTERSPSGWMTRTFLRRRSRVPSPAGKPSSGAVSIRKAPPRWPNQINLRRAPVCAFGRKLFHHQPDVGRPGAWK